MTGICHVYPQLLTEKADPFQPTIQASKAAPYIERLSLRLFHKKIRLSFPLLFILYYVFSAYYHFLFCLMRVNVFFVLRFQTLLSSRFTSSFIIACVCSQRKQPHSLPILIFSKISFFLTTFIEHCVPPPPSIKTSIKSTVKKEKNIHVVVFSVLWS